MNKQRMINYLVAIGIILLLSSLLEFPGNYLLQRIGFVLLVGINIFRGAPFTFSKKQITENISLTNSEKIYNAIFWLIFLGWGITFIVTLNRQLQFLFSFIMILYLIIDLILHIKYKRQA